MSSTSGVCLKHTCPVAGCAQPVNDIGTHLNDKHADKSCLTSDDLHKISLCKYVQCSITGCNKYYKSGQGIRQHITKRHADHDRHTQSNHKHTLHAHTHASTSTTSSTLLSFSSSSSSSSSSVPLPSSSIPIARPDDHDIDEPLTQPTIPSPISSPKWPRPKRAPSSQSTRAQLSRAAKDISTIKSNLMVNNISLVDDESEASVDIVHAAKHNDNNNNLQPDYNHDIDPDTDNNSDQDNGKYQQENERDSPAPAPASSSASACEPTPARPSCLPDCLPISYAHYQYLWRTVPRSVVDIFVTRCAQILLKADRCDKEGNHEERDKHYMHLLLLPREIMNRYHTNNSVHKLRKYISDHVKNNYDEIQPIRAQGRKISLVIDPHTRKIKKSVRLVKEGHLSRATRALLDSPIPPPTQHIIDQLRSLHPPASSPLPENVADNTPRMSITGADLRNQVQNTRFYDSGAAPGPSGWSGNMLLHLVRSGTMNCLDALANMFSYIMNGDIHSVRLKQLLLACKLLAVLKPNTNKYRPLAMGEIFIRICGTFILNKLDTPSLFPDIQLGVKVPGGAERALHVINSHLQHHVNDGTTILLSIDIENAFNTCSRAKILNGLIGNNAASPLVRMFHWAHVSPTPLLVYDTRGSIIDTLQSQEGVRQADVLGSVCFNVRVQAIYQETAKVNTHTKLIAIHDDTNMVGSYTHVFASFDYMKQLLETEGDLKLNPAKCRIIIPNTNIDDDTRQTIIQMTQDRGLTMVQQASMEILGGCVGGCDVTISNYVKTYCDNTEPLLQAIQHEAMPVQVAAKIVRQCIITKLGYISRVTPPQLAQQPLIEFDDAIFDTIKKIYQLPNALPDIVEKQISLPCKLGGLGITKTSDISPLAYFSSVLLALPSMAQLEVDSPMYKNLHTCYTNMSEYIGNNADMNRELKIDGGFDVLLSTYSQPTAAPQKTQHLLSTLYHNIDLPNYLLILHSLFIIEQLSVVHLVLMVLQPSPVSLLVPNIVWMMKYIHKL